MLIDQMKKEIDTHHGPVKVLVRKEVSNPADYFDKTYAEYQAGFSANALCVRLNWKWEIGIFTKMSTSPLIFLELNYFR